MKYTRNSSNSFGHISNQLTLPFRSPFIYIHNFYLAQVLVSLELHFKHEVGWKASKDLYISIDVLKFLFFELGLGCTKLSRHSSSSMLVFS